MGIVEVRIMAESIMKMVEIIHRDENNIFWIKPHFTYNDYLSGEIVCIRMDPNVFGL